MIAKAQNERLVLHWQDLEPARAIRWERWMLFFVCLGVLARSLRYVLRFPLWEDESFLCVSLFQRGFLELLEPLARHQVAPFLFLWLEKAMVLLFGYNELSLRLIPYLVSVVSIFLFAHLLRRLLDGPARVFCMAWYAVSYPGIRYAAEAKQYATDMFASLVLIVLVVEWLRSPTRRAWSAAILCWCPIAICLSLPAVFTVAAMSLLLFIAILRSSHLRQKRFWLGWIIYNLVFLCSLATVYVVSLRPQMQAELGFMSSCWNDGFVPLHSPWTLLKWLVTAHTGILFAHPVGDNNFGSSLTTLLCIIGVIYALRQRRALPVLLVVLPLAMHMGAAALQKYPYGGHFKFSMYIAPMIYLIMGVGCAVWVGARIQRQTTRQFQRTCTTVLILISSIGVVSMIRDSLSPYKTISDQRQRAVARWLWHSGNFEGQTVCLYDDLGLSFSKRTWEDLGWSAMYLCNKYIYGSSDILRDPRPANAPAPEHATLRCVLYRDMGKDDFQEETFQQWLNAMKAKHHYLGKERYPLPRYNKRHTALLGLG